MRFLVKYMVRFRLKKSYMNNIILYIWKIKNNSIKPAACCSWCKGIISKYGFPYKNVKTYQNTGILPSYVARPKIETKKKKPRITSGKFRKVKK